MTRCTNMNANTYTSNEDHNILWSKEGLALCPTNRQVGAWRGLQALFAFAGKTINRDIHRFWERIFRRNSVFLIETSPIPIESRREFF